MPVKGVQRISRSTDRPIERLGVEPDVQVRQTAEGRAGQNDAVLSSARNYLTQ